MDPATTVITRLASTAVAPLIKKLFVPEGPGAGLVDRPVRISRLVSFRGEQRTLDERGLRKLSADLVARVAEACGPHDAPSAEAQRELADALTVTLHSLGDLDMNDVQAVHLGPEGLARRLAAPTGLSAEAEAHFGSLRDTACLHVLNFFTTRSTFAAHTLVEQSRLLDQIIAGIDRLAERVPSQRGEDLLFEQRYAEHIARKHSELTIYGLDLNHAARWQLDSAYVSLAATGPDAVPLPADRALSGHERVLLRGGAGSGKTTLVQWLAVKAARGQGEGHLSHLLGRVPFVLPLRRIMREGLPPTPGDFLYAVRSAVAGEQPRGWAERVLRAGRGLLLVDGIDEIPRPEREETRRWIHELLGDFPGNMWLVTARPSAVGENWLTADGFADLSLSSMTASDVARFVRRWHRAAEAETGLAEQLLDAVRANGDLGRLAVNPLMCGLLCALHRERHGFLPHGRRNLYDAALTMLLERRDTERGIAVEAGLRLSSETQILLLQKLAHWLIRNDRAEMDRADAVGQLDRALTYMAHVQAPAERVLSHLLERSGLLREPAVGRVDFVHRTFQDYLGAKAVVEEGDFPLLLDNAHNDQWEDVVRMAVALGRPMERQRILNGLVEGVDVSELSGEKPAGHLLDVPRAETNVRRVLLAATCLEHATEIAPATRHRVLSLASVLVPPEDVDSAVKLAALGGRMMLGLLPAPGDLTDEQAECVVIVATRVGTDAAHPVLVRYRDHPALRVRRQLAWSWWRFDTEWYAAEILAHLDESDLYFSARSVEQLRILRGMGGRARIQVVGPYHPRDLLEHVDPERLTHLWLREGHVVVDGEQWLGAFPHLRTLVVPADAVIDESMIPPHVTVEHEPDEPASP